MVTVFIRKKIQYFRELQGDVAQNPNQKFRSPVIVMKGVNYGQFASKANITYDLNPEVSQADAFGIIFNYTYAFMVVTQNDPNKNIAAAKAVLEKGYINTETLLQVSMYTLEDTNMCINLAYCNCLY